MINSERARKTAEKIGNSPIGDRPAWEQIILEALNEAVKESQADLSAANKRIAELLTALGDIRDAAANPVWTAGRRKTLELIDRAINKHKGE